jgi:hypothetical protein
MKTILSIVLLLTIVVSVQAISIEQAVKQKLITLSITGADRSKSGVYMSSHAGTCLAMTIKNISTKPQTIELETGRMLQPDDSEIQPMMITQHQSYFVKAGEEKEALLSAYCCNSGKGGPGMTTTYNTGKMSAGLMNDIAHYIEDNKTDGSLAQHAVWFAASGDCYDCIYSDDTVVANKLRRFIYAKTGNKYVALKPDAKPQYNPKWYVTVNVTYNYTIPKQSKVTLSMLDEEGKLVKQFYNNDMQAAGTHSIDKEFIVEAGDGVKREDTYTVKLYVNDRFIFDHKFRVNNDINDQGW